MTTRMTPHAFDRRTFALGTLVGLPAALAVSRFAVAQDSPTTPAPAATPGSQTHDPLGLIARATALPAETLLQRLVADPFAGQFPALTEGLVPTRISAEQILTLPITGLVGSVVWVADGLPVEQSEQVFGAIHVLEQPADAARSIQQEVDFSLGQSDLVLPLAIAGYQGYVFYGEGDRSSPYLQIGPIVLEAEDIGFAGAPSSSGPASVARSTIILSLLLDRLLEATDPSRTA